MENFYNSKDIKEFQNKSDNPNLGKLHNIELFFRILIIGPSGSGKTNTLMNLIKKFNGTFDKFILCVKSKEEPIYKALEKKLGDAIDIYENGAVPKLSDIPKDGQQLAIFDDLVGDKNANPVIEEYFKMARKKDIACVYLSQSYFKTPKFIRDQCTYLIIKKVNSKRDFARLLEEYPLGELTKDQLYKIYNICTKKYEDCMIIDLLNAKIYHNFNKLIYKNS